MPMIIAYRGSSYTVATTSYNEKPSSWDHFRHWWKGCTMGPKTFFDGGIVLIGRCTQCGYVLRDLHDYDWHCLFAYAAYQQTNPAPWNPHPDDDAARGKELCEEFDRFVEWRKTVPHWDDHQVTKAARVVWSLLKRVIPWPLRLSRREK